MNRIIDTITGYSKARAAFEMHVSHWNDCNGKNRMQMDQFQRNRADDAEGSGEFYLMECANINTAESCDDEIWTIETCW